MKELTEADVLRIFREEWNARVDSLREDVELTLAGKVGNNDSVLISPELKVKHRTSGVKYTVDSVGPRDVILRTPEGEKFIVDAAELEAEYDLE